MISFDLLKDPTKIILTRAENQVFTELHDEIVILNVQSGKYYSLNAIGSLIWKKMDHPISLQSIINSIVDEYDVDPQKCGEDVCSLLMKLSQAGVVEIQTDRPIVKPDPQ